MKIILAGGSGHIGGILARELSREGHEIVILTRSPRPATAGAPRVREIAWNGRSHGPWAAELDGADAVINLAGRSVNCRYNARNRREILESRVDSTRAVGAAIAAASRPPPVWLQMSTATIYAHRYDAPNDEQSGILGGHEPGAPDTWRFSIDVANAWESAAKQADTPHTRKVLLRTAMTMSPDRGGVFDVLLGLVRRGLGGRAGSGRQYVSWIHEQDFVDAVRWLLAHEIDGPVNIAAPNPMPNTEFMRELRRAWGTRLGLPASKWMIEIGTRLMRTESELVLKSRRVVPGRLLASGFEFRFPSWPEAARDLCARWRAVRGGGVAAD